MKIADALLGAARVEAKCRTPGADLDGDRWPGVTEIIVAFPAVRPPGSLVSGDFATQSHGNHPKSLTPGCRFYLMLVLGFPERRPRPASTAPVPGSLEARRRRVYRLMWFNSNREERRESTMYIYKWPDVTIARPGAPSDAHTRSSHSACRV
jgi:hypothetical protein